MHSCWSWFQDVTFVCVYVSVNRGRNLSVENRRGDTRTRLLDMYGGSPVRLNYPNLHRKGAPYGLGKTTKVLEPRLRHSCPRGVFSMLR